MNFLGIDLGSSSVKVSVYNAEKGKVLASSFYPKEELPINNPENGWAEQDPEIWWESLKGAILEISSQSNLKDIKAIGISYQMHGLVVVDKSHSVIRPSIIWCDSRAVEIGEEAFNKIGKNKCTGDLLNSPGNFTASKLGWVKKYEPEKYDKIYKIMLPGDYLSMRMSGEITTTSSGLSEGIFWNFSTGSISKEINEHFGFDEELFPSIVPNIGIQSVLSRVAAEELGLSAGTPITYRSGDQPNNALSLNVLEPGELATTAGTSAVIYAVTDENINDQQSRINTFLHVNNNEHNKRNGILLCVNGSGILYSWLKKTLALGSKSLDYKSLNKIAESAPIGTKGLHFLPFGNGAERILNNRKINAQLLNLDFNTHDHAHIIRAAKEGIVYAMNYGLEIIREMGVNTDKIRAGASNLFLSHLFREAFVNTTGIPLELYETDGATGAARAASVGFGFQDIKEAFSNLKRIDFIEPSSNLYEQYQSAYLLWKNDLNNQLNV